MLAAFLLASLILAATPGPGVLYIVARSLTQGRAAGLASVAGVALGNLGNAAAASLGLAALFALSTLAFTLVKFGGAAYLVWLGFKTLRAPASAPSSDDCGSGRPALTGVFRDGFWVALLNPKTALFFAAFLPQFIDPVRPAMGQSLALGLAFVLIAAVTDSLYVLAARSLAPLLGRLRGASDGPGTDSGNVAASVTHKAGTSGLRWIGASVYFALGLLTAFSGGRAGQ